MIDETAAHLLFAALLSAVDAGLIVIAMNTVASGQNVEGWWAALVLAVSSYILMLFIICLPRLYSAYIQINSVSDALSGFTKGRRRRSP